MRAVAAYLGPSIRLSHLLPQSSEGDVPAFGLGWYGASGEPIRTASRTPLSRPDPALEVPDETSSHCVLAQVGIRSTEGQPFRHGPILFAHHGVIQAPQAVESALMARLSPKTRSITPDRSPDALLFLNFIEELRERTDPDSLADALEKTVGTVQDLATAHGSAATFTAVASDGDTLVTLRTGTSGAEAAIPPLMTRVCTEADPLPTHGRVVATRPTFEAEGWTALEPHSLVIFTRDV